MLTSRTTFPVTVMIWMRSCVGGCWPVTVNTKRVLVVNGFG